MRPATSRLVATAILVLTIAVGACGDGDGGSSAATSSTAEADSTDTTEVEETTTTDVALLPGQTAGLDDYNDDGAPDPTCGTQDFGGGLVLRLLCDMAGRNSEPPEGVTLVEGSLFRLPTDDKVDLNGISAWAVFARDEAGARVYVIVFQSDALFDTGSDVISETISFDNLVALINRDFAGSRLQVRGHTDSTGSRDSNQSLSERRAASVRAYLTDQGVDASEITTIGFGQSQPLAVEDTDAGLAFNRRVELVIRPPG